MVDRTRKWTLEDRAAAFECFFRTGSRAQVRKELGVPERTLSAWLTDDRFIDEKEAVQAGLLRALQEEAVRRGRELAEATSEAILVCRKALRRDPDGKTASSLLSALMRAREVEDRIGRLDHGEPTEIAGIKLAPEDREAFEQWYGEHQESKQLGREGLVQRLHDGLINGIGLALQPQQTKLLHGVLAALCEPGSRPVADALRDDLPLARSLVAIATAACEQAEEHRLLADDADSSPPTDSRS